VTARHFGAAGEGETVSEAVRTRHFSAVGEGEAARTRHFVPLATARRCGLAASAPLAR